jgi:hypothetical protein
LAHSHVGGVQVGTFLPVDLNADEGFVEELCHFLILEAFLLHNMAPVACGVAYTKENGFVFKLGFVESLLTPRIPIDRVVSMLE